MKKGCLYSMVVLVVVAVYVYFDDKVVVAYSKIDTLYMVSTIFYSAVIGMVISNNVHLGNALYRNEIRKYYRTKRNALTAFFIVTTTLYFVLDISFFQDLSKRMKVNLPLLALCVIILFIFYNLESMGAISSGVAMIEDNDLDAEEVKLKQQVILAYMKECGDISVSKKKILEAIINVRNTKENEKKYIIPLVEQGLLNDIRHGNSNYYQLKIKK